MSPVKTGYQWKASWFGDILSSAGRQERGVERREDIRQMSPGPGLEPGTATSRTAASAHGHPYTISATPRRSSF
ncbi:hypothetical protein ATANTOWER_021247 [Ataeniobius toweri]|uniref:Uncharacterized protein n=1 Tax=Ataeniobius toweri TaxID=208326 RepID=A0ABU7B9K3_9TELE|nr:hypothetical protein [Ataeniobius toweri]